MRRAWFFLVCLLPLIAAAQGSLRDAIELRYPGIHWVDAPTLARWMRAERPPLLLDVRSAEEFAVSHLRGARRIDPDAPDLDAVPRDGRRIAVYCSVGYRSGAIVTALGERGIRAFNLEGGIFAWANAGRPIFRRARRAQRVHPYDATWGRLLRPELRARQ